MTGLNLTSVERAARGCALRVPRLSYRGRAGDARSSSVGSSLELHDFRAYSPGDDLRHVDWNAVARTGELVLRVRQEEVSPRLELIIDGSASMRVSEEKAARAREVAWWVYLCAQYAGLEVSVSAEGSAPVHGAVAALSTVQRLPFDGRASWATASTHQLTSRSCGVRVVVSDFLAEAEPGLVVQRLARSSQSLILIQVLDGSDLDPTFGGGARLIDSESGEAVEQLITSGVLADYHERFSRHVALWTAEAKRVRAHWVQVDARRDIEALAKTTLAALVERA